MLSELRIKKRPAALKQLAVFFSLLLFLFFSLSPALSAQNGTIGRTSTGSATISLTIPPRIDMKRSTHSVVLRSANGATVAETSLCLHSNIPTQLRALHRGKNGWVSGTAQTCGSSRIGSSFVTEIGNGHTVVMLEPV